MSAPTDMSICLLRGIMLKIKRESLSRVRIIVLSFLLVIIVGTTLLMLPWATRQGAHTSLLDAFFTAVSATCVTGLVAADTWSHWTIFGQFVILAMIQIGGLGFITIASLFFFMTKRQMNLSQRFVLQDSISAFHNGGVVRLVKKVLAGTVLIEGIGAMLLSIRFVPKFGVIRGIYYGIFHAVSAFCNAGFDLMGCMEPYSSFTGYYNDVLITAVLSSLILIGGIGFIVWDDVSLYRLQFRRYSLQSKIVLWATGLLVLVPGILFFLTEYHGLMEHYRFGERICASLFSAVTPRTAGFNSIDTAGLSDAGYLLTVILMFIGGGPGSTAGGIKITTVMILVLSCVASMRRERSIHIFGRRIDHDSVARAANVFMVNLALALSVTFFICLTQNLPIRSILFETISAISTVGMSTGVTRDLNVLSKLLIALLMFCGRVGSLSFALALTSHKQEPPAKLPLEQITIG